MPIPDDIGNLILMLNPYTGRTIPNTNPARDIGPMDPYCRNPVPGTPGNIAEIVVESDGPYRQDWAFKGEPQRVGMAYRIRYRFPVTNGPGGPVLYWLEDYVLIGFEGAMGG